MIVPINGINYEIEYDTKSGSPTTYSPMSGAYGGDADEVTIQNVYLGEQEVKLSDDEMQIAEEYIIEHHDWSEQDQDDWDL